MAAGLPGVCAALGDRYGRLARTGVGLAAVGMAIVAVLELRSVIALARAGFRPVPAAGEDPAELVVTWAALLGFGLVLAGAGGRGLDLGRTADAPGARLTAALLLAAPAVPLVVIALRSLSLAPPWVGRLAVTTNAAFVPLGFGWAALGATVAARARSADHARP